MRNCVLYTQKGCRAQNTKLTGLVSGCLFVFKNCTVSAFVRETLSQYDSTRSKCQVQFRKILFKYPEVEVGEPLGAM